MLIPPYCITLCTQRADVIIILVQFCGPNNAAECTSVDYFHPATAHQLQRLRHLAALFGLVKCPQIQYFMILSALRLSKAMQCDGIDPLGYTTKGRDWWIPCMRINSSSGCLLSSDNAWVTRLGVVHARGVLSTCDPELVALHDNLILASFFFQNCVNAEKVRRLIITQEWNNIPRRTAQYLFYYKTV